MNMQETVNYLTKMYGEKAKNEFIERGYISCGRASELAEPGSAWYELFGSVSNGLYQIGYIDTTPWEAL